MGHFSSHLCYKTWLQILVEIWWNWNGDKNMEIVFPSNNICAKKHMETADHVLNNTSQIKQRGKQT
jgi:hypothetical protein